MSRYMWTTLLFIVATATAFMLDSRFHALPQALTYLGWDIGLKPTPIVAAALVGIVCMALGLLTATVALVVVPVIFSAAYVTMLAPPFIGKAWLGLAQIQATVAIAAVIGAFILMEARSMWRIRENRFVSWLWVGLSIAAINFALFLLFTKSGSSEAVLTALGLTGFGLLSMLFVSNKAIALRDKANSERHDATLAAGLQKERNDYKAAYEKAHGDNGELQKQIAALKGRLAERGELVEALKAAGVQQSPAQPPALKAA